jgi:hypothetical protein
LAAVISTSTPGAGQVDAFEQRAGHRLLGGDAGAVRAAGHRGAHHGLAGLAHHGAHVLEVDVHMAGHVDDLGNAAHGVFQHVVGVGEGLILGDVVAEHLEQLFVQHHDQRVDVGFELGQAGVGVVHAAPPFPVEGLGDHAHRENAHLLGHARDHRRGAGARAAAHAGGDEQHVRAFDRGTDVLDRVLRRMALFGLAAGAQAADAELDGAMGGTARQGLRIGVGADELDAADAAIDHVFDGVAAAAADADHLDLGAQVEFLDFNHFYGHVCFS